MESINKLLTVLLSQYRDRPHGSINEKSLLSTLKNELHKTCDVVEEQSFKVCPYLTKFKWVFISLYFCLLMTCGLIHSLALVTVSTIGTVCYWLVYDLEVRWIEKILPGVKTHNLYGQINCIHHNHCFSEKTVLLVAHTSDCYKDRGIIHHLSGILLHLSIYFMLILSCVACIVGTLTNNHILAPVSSVLCVPLVILSASMFAKGKRNKVSGLATSTCLLSVLNHFNQSTNPLNQALQTTNIAFLITPSHTERHEGIRSFIHSFKKEHKEKLMSTIVLCLDELDDSETLKCFRKEGIFCHKYSKSLIDTLIDTSQQEDIPFSCVSNWIHKPFTAAHEFRGCFKEVIPLTAPCSPFKQLQREEKEAQIKRSEETICIHDDQMKCIDNCSRLLYRYLTVIDTTYPVKEFTMEMTEQEDHLEMEILPSDTINGVILDDSPLPLDLNETGNEPIQL